MDQTSLIKGVEATKYCTVDDDRGFHPLKPCQLRRGFARSNGSCGGRRDVDVAVPLSVDCAQGDDG